MRRTLRMSSSMSLILQSPLSSNRSLLIRELWIGVNWMYTRQINLRMILVSLLVRLGGMRR